MRILTALLLPVALALGFLAPTSSADTPVKRLLYVTSRDGAGGKGDKGIYVYDMDDGHKLVRFIEMPKMGGTRGSCACAATATWRRRSTTRWWRRASTSRRRGASPTTSYWRTRTAPR